jgi:hypothetical protein
MRSDTLRVPGATLYYEVRGTTRRILDRRHRISLFMAG